MDKNVRLILGFGVIGAAFYLIWKNNRNQMVSGLQVPTDEATTTTTTSSNESTLNAPDLSAIKEREAVASETKEPTTILESRTGQIFTTEETAGFNGYSGCDFC